MVPASRCFCSCLTAESVEVAPCSIVSSSTYIELSSYFGWSLGMVGMQYSTKRTGESGNPWGSPESKGRGLLLGLQSQS